MKIAFFSAFQEGYGGGEGTVTFELAYAAAKRNQVALILPGKDISRSREKNGLIKLTTISLAEKDFAVQSLSGKNVQAIMDFLDKFKPDVIHAHTPTPTCMIGQIWAIQNDVPFVYTAHIIPSKLLDFMGIKSAKIMGKVLKAPLRQYVLDFYNNCAFIVALNKTALVEIRKFGYKGKIELIPNGRNIHDYYVCKFANTKALTKELAFTGFINARKNQKFLIETMQFLPANYHLTLIGPVLDKNYQKILELMKKEKKLKNISFTGKVPQSDIPKFMEKAHVFVSASKMEVQSLVILEALASGTPVVGLSNETMDELINDKNGKWLHKNTKPKQFANEILKVCSLDQDHYNRLCENARHTVAHLDWSEIVDKTTLTYQKYIDIYKNEGQKNHKKTRIEKLVDLIPIEKTKEYLLTRIKEHDEKEKPRNAISDFNKVPKKTLMFAGITMLLTAIVLGAWRTARFVKKQSDKIKDHEGNH